MKCFLESVVRDVELCRPIPGVSIVARSSEGTILGSTATEAHGQWSLHCSPEAIIHVGVNHPEFLEKQYPARSVPQQIRLLSRQLVGYQDRLTHSPGAEAVCLVNATGPFRAGLFRHGQCKELVLDLGEHSPTPQTAPDQSFVSTGLDWRPTFEYRIPEDSAPGLYSVLLTDLNNPASRFAIPMAVSSHGGGQTPKNPLLVLASTSTWQSYNIYGGRSRYRNFEEGKSPAFNVRSGRRRVRDILKDILPFVPWRALKSIIRPKTGSAACGKDAWKFLPLSVRRPFTNCALEPDDPREPFTNHLAGGEWRLLAWLEREGIGYDYASTFDLHNDPGLLKGYRGVILSTHCEYWSSRMYHRLRDAHFDHGLWILNLSGNSIYREIDYGPGESTRCVSLSFSDSCADETELLGVRFDMKGYGTCAPFKVVDRKHPLFQGCKLAENGRFGFRSLNRQTAANTMAYDPGRPGSGTDELKYGLRGEGASGWETDKLAGDRLEEFEVLARGLNEPGGADMVYRPPHDSRGGLFSASSLVFPASLLIDQAGSQLVKNVLSEAGLYSPPSHQKS